MGNNNVKFVVDIETAKGIRAYLDLLAAEKKAEQGMQEMARSAGKAEQAAVSAAKSAAKEYELAGASMRRNAAIPLPRTAGGTFIRPGRGGAYDVASLPAPTRTGAPLAAAADTYSLAPTFDQWLGDRDRTARFLRAQQIRAERAAQRRNLATAGRAAGNLFEMDQLIESGQRSIQSSATRRYGRGVALSESHDRLIQWAQQAHARAEQRYTERTEANTQRIDQRVQASGRLDLAAFERAHAKKEELRAQSGHLAVPEGAGFSMIADKAALVGTAAAAVVGGAYLVGKTFESVAAEFDKVGAAGVKFEKDLTPLLSLGQNSRNIASVKEHVLALSGSMGMDTASAASSTFMLQSAAANLGPGGQRQIMQSSMDLNKVAGGELQTDLVAVTKLMQTYGKEMGTAQVAAAKLLATENDAAITMDELATLLPDIIPAAKLMGHSYDEVAASVITATQVMGTNEKTLTGLRNMFLKLGEAQQKGIVHQGRLIDQLKELEHADPIALQTLFGERTVSVVAALAEKTGEMAKNLKTMQAVTGSGVLDKFVDRMKDSAGRNASTLTSVQTELTNVDAIRGQDAGTGAADLKFNLTKLGQESLMGPTQKALMPGWLKNLQIAERLHEKDSNNNFLQKGLDIDIANKRKAGGAANVFAADLEMIQFGAATGTYTSDKAGRKHYTDESDADRYVDLASQMKGHLSGAQFLQYEQMERSNPAGAAAFLATLQKAADQIERAAASHAAAAAKNAEAANKNLSAAGGEKSRQRNQ